MLSRRDFGKIAVAAVPSTLAAQGGRGRPLPKPNSKFAGVQVGVITYSFMGVQPADMLSTIVKLGINEVELMSNHAEAMVSAPSAAGRGGAPPAGGVGGRGPAPAASPASPPIPPVTPWYSGDACAGRTQPAAGAARTPAPVNEDVARWRTATETMNKYRDLRKQFDDAGVNLGVLCYNMNASVTDDEIDYAFRMAQALGVRAISSSSTVTVAKRVAGFADKYKLTWSGHGHDDETFEKIIALSPYIGINLDIGHFTAGGYDAVAFIRRYNARITNLHLKDRVKNPQGGGRGQNLRWGDGETPIKEVLQLMRREQYPFPANIEYEYQGTDSVIEVAKCLQYCKDALLG
jgi:sugar phosphate isomerase/epimerase